MEGNKKKDCLDSYSEHGVRCENLIPLFMSVNSESSSEILSEAIALEEEVCDLLGITDSEYEELKAEGFRDLSILTRKGKTGYLAQMATPVPSFYKKTEAGDETGYSFSWGYYRTQWFYADSVEEICNEALQWANRYLEAKRRVYNQEN